MHTHGARKLCSAFRPGCELIGKPKFGRSVDDSRSPVGGAYLYQLDVRRKNMGCSRIIVCQSTPQH
jgi:hypothetical protein